MDMTYYKRYEPFFGTWYITKMLGEGSFGRVFEIERQDFGEIYKAALKIITVPQSESEVRSVMSSGMDKGHVTEYFEGVVREIVSEFVLMSKLKGNSHVVSYEDHQVIPHKGKRIGWDILIRMELLTPLLDYAENTKLTRKDIMKLGIDMCHALELCQKHNIIHRDIKPENIFVSENGNYKLGDFGIARTIEKTNSGMSKKGTYTYMAPEVYKGEKYGSSVDIYSLGVVLYRLLNKNRTLFLPPFPEKIKHSDIDKALIRRISGDVPLAPSEADGRLAEIVLKACSYNPKDRYSSPMQMRQELEAILYEADKANMVYPKGDDVPIEPNEYATSDEEVTDKVETICEGTVSIFGEALDVLTEQKSTGNFKSVKRTTSTALSNDFKLCEHCGISFLDGAKFCMNCGAKKRQHQLKTQDQDKESLVDKATQHSSPLPKRDRGKIVAVLSFVVLFFILSWSVFLRESAAPADYASTYGQMKSVIPNETVEGVFEPVWLIAPTLEHDIIWFCDVCEKFFDSNWYEINKTTGELTGDGHFGHGGSQPARVYDPARELFGDPGYNTFKPILLGMHPYSEFVSITESQLSEWEAERNRNFMIVEKVDSSEREKSIVGENESWVLAEDAFTGKYAIMHHGRQITDFIFDGACRQLFIEGENLSFAVVSKNGYWGVVDESGNTLVPFIFEHMVSIDENTAFAKYNGYYGILDIQRLIE